ncbi:hypothetical protein B0J12DRAFT_766215 [Macrophomina phaseolina]|uniref:Protein kinase domain-containing protein n=1 Tax=Macrophomina phaseolina TaxID=35725 RepID=A0ABQ8FYE4_9PEZI|nr:hypothetical protein B0J12DRAFT_766215 [Macrophomina phaseolina]
MKRPSHKNIASIVDAFYYEGSRFTVYEYMVLSLDYIAAAPLSIAEHHVATICSEVLHGLRYIHETLGLRHGFITAANVLFSMSGTVKIGRCLSNDIAKCSAHKDAKATSLNLCSKKIAMIFNQICGISRMPSNAYSTRGRQTRQHSSKIWKQAHAQHCSGSVSIP